MCEHSARPDEDICVSADVYGVLYLDAQRTAFFVVSLAFGIYYVLSITNCVASIRERKMSEESKTAVPLVPSILRAFKNRAFRPLLVAWALDGLALSSLVTMFPFFIRYVVISDGSKAQAKGVQMDPTVSKVVGLCGDKKLFCHIFVLSRMSSLNMQCTRNDDNSFRSLCGPCSTQSRTCSVAARVGEASGLYVLLERKHLYPLMLYGNWATHHLT